MSKKEVTNLACKLLAIYTIIFGLTGGLSNLAFAIGQGSASLREVVITSLGPFVMFVVGMGLWFLSGKLSDYIGNEKQSGKFETSNKKTVEEIQTIAFSVLGLFFIGAALPKAVTPIMLFLAPNMGPGLNWQAFGQLLQVVVQLAFGLWLLLGAQGLVNFLKKVRRAGVQQNHDRM